MNKRAVLYSSALCVLLLGFLLVVGRSMLTPSSAQPCGERLPNGTVFSLERNGTLLTGPDIVDRAGPGSIGVVENVEVMRPRDTTVPAAMQIELRTKPSRNAASSKAGMAFPWQPRSVQDQAAACLSYKAFFYADLDFQGGGVLPGLQGVDQTGRTQDRFAANLAWRQDGEPGVSLAITKDGETQILSAESKGVAFPKADWIKIDQEVILNEPGQDDGVLRVWIDGSLVIEQTNLSFRSKADVMLSGAAANVSYGAADAMAWAPSDTRIWISSLLISWR